MNWWRAHHGISNDSKLAVVAVQMKAKRCEVGWVWVILLDYASQNEKRGSIVGLDHEQISIMADLPLVQVSEIIGQLTQRGLIQQDGNLTAWTKRQPVRERADETSTERVKRFRNKKQTETPCNAKKDDETPCNANETPVAVKKTEKRTTEQIRKALGDRLPWWLEFWKVYPCHDGMNRGMDAFERRVQDHELAVAMYKTAKRYGAQIAEKRKTEPDAPCKFAQGWINDERWTDEAAPDVAPVQPKSIYKLDLPPVREAV